MNLQTSISEDLWNAVASPYDSGNYSHAILEAFHYLTSFLREHADVDGDGATVVGQAFGGDSPRLRVNSLQTETERNVQKGLEQLLRGMYLAIRNPRSHEQITDTKEAADAVVYFLNHILGLLNASQKSFTIDGFIGRVLDPEFVETPRYAELLVSELPALRRGEALIAIYHNRRRADLRKLRYVINDLRDRITANQLSTYLAVVSEELRATTDEATIRTALQMLTPDLWPRLAEVARLRIEHKLLGGIHLGEVSSNGKTNQALATWANSFLRAFSIRQDVASVLVNKLEHNDARHRRYVAKFFMRPLPEVIIADPLIDRAVQAIASAVRENDETVRTALLAYVRFYPQGWQAKIAAALQDLTDPNNPAVVLDDGTPLLSSPTSETDQYNLDDPPF